MSLPALPPIEVEEMRAVALSFPVDTAVVDGASPRHFAYLSDACLKGFCRLLFLIELVGDFPPAARDLLVCLLPKPQGGVRPIGLYRSLKRLWGRCRRRFLRKWEVMLARHPAFGASSGDGVLRRGLAPGREARGLHC